MGYTALVALSLIDVSSASIAADSTGAKDIPVEVEIPATIETKTVLDAYVAISYVWAATADGTFQLVDDAGNVIAESSAKTGGESASFEKIPISAAALQRVLGKRVHLRVNITTAGASGETVTIRNAQLVIVFYVER